MRRLPYLFAAFALFALCSCEDLERRHQLFVEEQNRGKFTVALTSPQANAGKTEVQFTSPFPFAPLRTIDINILYFPVEDAACLQYRVDGYTHHLFWSRESRDALVKALEDYGRDFDTQNLIRTGWKTTNIYGTVHGYLYWQAGSITVQGRGNMMIDLGYAFQSRSPFFLVRTGNAEYLNPAASGRNSNVNSGERSLYFTKAQAAIVAECFNQQYLESLKTTAGDDKGAANNSAGLSAGDDKDAANNSDELSAGEET